jgi:hypothetical protein
LRSKPITSRAATLVEVTDRFDYGKTAGAGKQVRVGAYCADANKILYPAGSGAPGSCNSFGVPERTARAWAAGNGVRLLGRDERRNVVPVTDTPGAVERVTERQILSFQGSFSD